MVLISNGFVQKRRFTDIRHSILLSLSQGQKTLNHISIETQINWKTVDNHLVYLMGKGLVREAFRSSYVRIFELTAFGKDYLRKHLGKNVQISDKKIMKVNNGEL